MIKCQLAVILGQRRAEGLKPYNFAALARESKLHFDTIANLASNRTTRYDAHVLDTLCRVLDVDLSDLLIYDSSQPQPWPERKRPKHRRQAADG